MILGRAKLFGISSVDGKCLETEMRDVLIFDTRDFSVHLPAGFHERLVARLANAERFKIT
jgi:hypothetical protein